MSRGLKRNRAAHPLGRPTIRMSRKSGTSVPARLRGSASYSMPEGVESDRLRLGSWSRVAWTRERVGCPRSPRRTMLEAQVLTSVADSKRDMRRSPGPGGPDALFAAVLLPPSLARATGVVARPDPRRCVGDHEAGRSSPGSGQTGQRGRRPGKERLMKRSGRVILVDFSGRYALLGKRKRWHRDARRKTKFRRMPVTRRGWVSKAALGSAMVAASICGAWSHGTFLFGVPEPERESSWASPPSASVPSASSPSGRCFEFR